MFARESIEFIIKIKQITSDTLTAVIFLVDSKGHVCSLTFDPAKYLLIQKYGLLKILKKKYFKTVMMFVQLLLLGRKK